MRLLSVLALPILVLAEIAVFILVGRALGIWTTLGLTVLSAALGLALVAAQGVYHLVRLRQTLAAGELPVADMIHGLLLLIAGFLLFIPGFITDLAGALLLLPPLRAALGRGLLRRWRGRMTAQPPGGATIIEGDYRESAPPAAGRLPNREDHHDERR